jgi:hypothetical protein
MISILFAAKDSIYKTIPDLDVWDEDRDALKWLGGNPGVFHPPCRLWSKWMGHLAKAPLSEMELARWSVEQVKKWGGILEHPAESKLFKEMNLPHVEVDQFHWGHLMRKRTWLYVCGISCLPPMPFRKGDPEVRWDNRNSTKLPYLTKKQRQATPLDFALWLVEAAKNAI